MTLFYVFDGCCIFIVPYYPISFIAKSVSLHLLLQFGGMSLACATPLWPLRFGGFKKKSKSKQPRILILMSDTGGGHRASAEAIKGGFDELYGVGKYHVDVLDIWTHHTPWPFNQLPKSYSFMVKYPIIWRTNFNMTQPRVVHVPLTVATAAVAGRQISEAYDIYKPNLVISVHPLMQVRETSAFKCSCYY